MPVCAGAAFVFFCGVSGASWDGPARAIQPFIVCVGGTLPARARRMCWSCARRLSSMKRGAPVGRVGRRPGVVALSCRVSQVRVSRKRWGEVLRCLLVSHLPNRAGVVRRTWLSQLSLFRDRTPRQPACEPRGARGSSTFRSARRVALRGLGSPASAPAARFCDASVEQRLAAVALDSLTASHLAARQGRDAKEGPRDQA